MSGMNADSGSQRKRLPVKPSLEHLRKQAKRMARAAPAMQLADAQHRVAAEYGCKSWAELAHVVEVMNRGADQLANVKRVLEGLPKAVRARDVALVREILASGEFTFHDLDAGLAHAVWYGGDEGSVLAVRRELAELLLAHGADPDGQYGSDYGPIVFGTGECQSVEGLEWLLEAGCDVTFPPVETKYGWQCPMSYWLGTYVRGDNAAKHRGVRVLLERGAYVPPEVSPAVLAVHLGDVEGLRGMLRADGGLVSRRFAEMPYGNVELRGATLLHAAVEFCEFECVDLLLDFGAEINARSDVVDSVGGQTPVFHVVGSYWERQRAMLRHLIDRVGGRIDVSVRATFRTFGEVKGPMDVIEVARASKEKTAAGEVELLEALRR